MRYAYCPACGAPIGERSPDVLVCGSCGYRFYQNSKPTACAVIIRRVSGVPHVVLARRGIEPYLGEWDLPGGFLRNGEEPLVGLERELQEELGIRVPNLRLLSMYVDEYLRPDIAYEARFTLSIYYLGELAGEIALAPADDVADATWFPLRALPERLSFPCNRKALREAARALGEPINIPG